ncbi:DNA polymerase III subunit delta' [Lactobacillus sp. LC28-10]|uniref:DNA polymerase III subunit delta n=1 Tax=Secundilactobacillus angelensis TaxID=2722706 RepID=A0ABX1L2G0_9LACO|nr:DNA polymerase III subunit delta' [Secundilactobacillus angelensis]MCH5462225.1 DNA polymerase III subunit delta' [Secundilactobacillus angelensis]NLR18516.1 DNA polymerase III subunit delta' [Secundilactobacillus angelensis]
MAGQNLIEQAESKQPQLMQHFIHLVATKRLSHAYLFSGLPGCGKRAVAQVVAMGLFCQNPNEDGMPCGQCPECGRILAGDNPDVVTVQPDGQRIKVDQVRYIKDEFAKSPVEGSIKVFIIEGAETLTTNAANGLLKFIEEPVANRVIFLLTTNKSMMLATILSRTQIVEFPSLTGKAFAETLRENHISENQIPLLSGLTNSLDDAQQLVVDDWLANCQHELSRWFGQLAKRDDMAFVTVQTGLMPLAHDKDHQAVILDAIILLWQDTLQTKYLSSDAQTVFPALQTTLTEIASSLSRNQLLTILTAALATKKALAGNMNIQSILETLTLQILAAMTQTA